MSDDQLFWGGVALGAAGLLTAIGALVWPHLVWLLEQRRRRPMRRAGSIFQERR